MAAFHIFKKDRRGGDRRKIVDPRYKNADYPDFVERRSNKERRCQEDCGRSFWTRLSEDGAVWLGLTAGGLILFLFMLSILNLKAVNS